MKILIRLAFAALLFAALGPAESQTNTFYKFAPATGVLKGDVNSYVTTAAVAADIKGLWSGTCDATTFLRGDGSCVTPSGTGITFSMPSGFSVTGSPGSTISVSTGLNGVLKGNGSGFTTAAAADIYGLWSGTCNSTTFLQGNGACGQVSLSTQVSGALGVTNGGNGLSTAALGDLRYGSGTNTIAALAGNTTATKKYLTQTGTGSVSAAPAWNTIASADVISGWTGTCSSTTFLRGDGSCQTPSGGGSVTSISAGTGISLSPSPIVSSGSVSIDTTVVPRLGAVNAFLASQEFIGGGGSNISATGMLLSATPSIQWQNNGGAVDTKIWDCHTNTAADLQCRAVNDAFSSSNNWLDVNRTGTTINSITFPQGGIEVGTPTGASKGTGTINTSSTIYVNNVPVPAGVAHLASCYVTVSGTTPTLVNTFGCSGVSRSAVGHYTVTFNAGFTARPPCTVSAYGGDFIANTSDPSNSGTMDFLFDAITGGTRADPTGFMITCLGN